MVWRGRMSACGSVPKVNTTQTEPLQLGLSNMVHVHLMTRGRHLLLFKAQGQGHMLDNVVKPCKQD